MKNILILSLTFFVLYGCNAQNNNNVEEVSIDIDYYDSIDNDHREILKRIEVEASLKQPKKSYYYRVFQSVITESLNKDTLSIIKDGSYWAYPDSIRAGDEDIWFQYDIALKDIDTNKITYSIVDDVMWINIASKDTLGAFWGKFDLELQMWHWRTPANEVRIGFLTSMDKIKSNFKSYEMYNPDLREPSDYTKSKMDSLSMSKMFKEIKSTLIEYSKK